jgi:hypothetical protein
MKAKRAPVVTTGRFFVDNGAGVITKSLQYRIFLSAAKKVLSYFPYKQNSNNTFAKPAHHSICIFKPGVTIIQHGTHY